MIALLYRNICLSPTNHSGDARLNTPTDSTCCSMSAMSSPKGPKQLTLFDFVHFVARDDVGEVSDSVEDIDIESEESINGQYNY